MRKRLSILVGLAMLAAAGVLPQPASAGSRSLSDELAMAKADHQGALDLVHKLEKQVDSTTARYRTAQADLESAARDVFISYQERLIVEAQLFEAQDILDRQARAAYEAGPGLPLELLLRSRTAADIDSFQIFAARAIHVDQQVVDRVKALRQVIKGTVGGLEQRQHRLAEAARSLDALARQALVDLDHAHQIAKAAGIKVKGLEDRQNALLAAEAASTSPLNGLVQAERGLDQTQLLARLGPNQGRGCDIPSGLTPTGQQIAGLASWYGPGFAGRTTASGAIFDPRLFTAANKDLPLN